MIDLKLFGFNVKNLLVSDGTFHPSFPETYNYNVQLSRSSFLHQNSAKVIFTIATIRWWNGWTIYVLWRTANKNWEIKLAVKYVAHNDTKVGRWGEQGEKLRSDGSPKLVATYPWTVTCLRNRTLKVDVSLDSLLGSTCMLS